MKRGRFAFEALTLAAGTAIAQGIALLTVPLLTRLYRPSDGGLAAIFFSIVNILLPLATGQYASAVMLPKEEEDAFGVFQLSFCLSLAFGLLALFLLPFVGDSIEGLAETGGAGEWVLLLPLGIVIASSHQVLFLWANRKREFHLMALSRVLQVGTMVTVQFLAAVSLAAAGLGLITGRIVGYSAALVLIGWRTLGESVRSVGWVGFARLKGLMARYKNFPLFMSPGGLLDNMSFQLVPLLLASFFATKVVGFYALAYSVVSLPISLIGKSVSHVVFQRASEKWNLDRDISGIVGRVFSAQFLISAPIALVLFLGGPALFSVVFGERWAASGELVRILSPLFFLQLIVSPLTLILVVLERQRLLLTLQALLFATAVFPLIIGGVLKYDFFRTITYFAAAQAVAYAVYLGAILRAASVSWREVKEGLGSVGATISAVRKEAKPDPEGDA